MSPILSRPFAEADAALQRFLDKGAASYEACRNFDYGPANRNNVSQLSKFISHRVLFEYEVAQRALAIIKISARLIACGAFIQKSL